jgi:hypothetical protein
MRIEKVLTQHELVIDLSRGAMAIIAHAIETREPLPLRNDVKCEVDNFVNTLLNLIERGVDKTPEPVQTSNLDLI